MPNRIDDCFSRLRSQKQKGFIPYICAGDPSLSKTVDISLALEKAGSDVLELGVPFSDPLADGIVNQLAAQRALEAGATVLGVLGCVGEIRRRSQIPIVLYTYLNPILRYGMAEFEREAAAAGVDGLLILDLPPEEDHSIQELDGLKPSSSTIGKDENQVEENPIRIRLIAPTTPRERIAVIAASARGFIYYVSRECVTGARQLVAESLEERLTMIRQHTDLSIEVGFGFLITENAS